VKLSSGVILRDGIDPEEGRSVNISLGGIYICAQSPRPKGSEVEVEFVLPPNRRMRVKGRVVRTSHHKDEKYPTGMAISFLYLPPEGKEEIDEYVRKTCRILRALFFELNRVEVNEKKIWQLVKQSPIEYRYPLDILREKVAAELAYLKLRAGSSFRE